MPEVRDDAEPTPAPPAAAGATFSYEPTFQYGHDETTYRLLSKDHVSTVDLGGRTLLKVEPEALRLLAKLNPRR